MHIVCMHLLRNTCNQNATFHGTQLHAMTFLIAILTNNANVFNSSSQDLINAVQNPCLYIIMKI